MTKESKYRNPVFDVMKGIGILLVMWGHAPGINETIETFLSAFHMPMFFLLSGYFTKSTVDFSNFCQFLRKLSLRLVVPYVLTLIVIAVWFSIFAIAKYDYSGLQLVGRKLIGMDNWTSEIGWMPIWFLMALFWAKILFYLISWQKPWLVMMESALISLVAVLLHMQFDFGLPFHILRGCQALVYIAIGWWVRNHNLPFWLYVIFVCCWFFQSLMGYHELMFPIEYDCWPLNVLAGCGGTCCFYACCKYAVSLCQHKSMYPILNALLWLGASSLALICMHDIELNCSFIRIPLHRVPMVETYCGTWIRYIITIALVWLLSKWSGFRKIFIG